MVLICTQEVSTTPLNLSLMRAKVGPVSRERIGRERQSSNGHTGSTIGFQWDRHSKESKRVLREHLLT